MKWLVYTRGTIHPHRLSLAFPSFREAGKKLIGIPIYDVLYINKGSKLWWAWDEDQINRVGDHILEIIKTRKNADNHFKKFTDWSKRAINASEKIRKLDLTKLSSRKLIDLYDFLYKEGLEAHASMNPIIDAIDVVFESFLEKKIRQELPIDINQKEFIRIYKSLVVPVYQTYISQQEIEIIKTALKKKIIDKDIDRLYNRFWWTKLGWENVAPHTREYFSDQVKKYLRQKNLSHKLKGLEEKLKSTKEIRQKVIRKYNLSNRVKYWLGIMDRYTYFHDVRKEMQVKTMYAAYLIMSEAARRLGLDKNDLEWLLYDEVKDLLQGKKFNKEEIKRRRQAVCIIISKDGIKIWSGAAALKKYKKELPAEVGGLKELKGTGVTKGKVKARVKICSGAIEAFEKVKKGDILVCGMTLPDYVPVMKRASAIITDEGGITCHAAVVSRELKIPCVVGTKIATQVFKDGDLVEVDAEQGIVKKLNN